MWVPRRNVVALERFGAGVSKDPARDAANRAVSSVADGVLEPLGLAQSRDELRAHAAVLVHLEQEGLVTQVSVKQKRRLEKPIGLERLDESVRARREVVGGDRRRVREAREVHGLG